MENNNAKTWEIGGIMDPINIIVALNIIATFGANVTTAKKGFRSVITSYKEKPKSFASKCSGLFYCNNISST